VKIIEKDYQKWIETVFFFTEVVLN